MARYACPNGHEWTSLSKLSKNFDPACLLCPDCGAAAKFGRNSTSTGFGLKAMAETPEHRAARERFDRLVCEWPCWGKRHRPGHSCRGPKDAHHLVPKDWIGRTFSDLPEDELLAIMFEPVIGMPACRFVLHDALETRADVVLLHELRDDVRLFCKSIDEKYPGHPSMLGRLELESPPSRALAA
jgi:hypothetical protein